MIKYLKGEIWKQVKSLKGLGFKKNYAVSNLGRFASYKKNIEEGEILNGSLLEGYRVYRMRIDGRSKTFMLHKFVAECFCKRKSKLHDRVIHINHDKLNNTETNLAYVTRPQMIAHHQTSPAVIAQKGRITFGLTKGHKLTAKMVLRIKKLINNPKRRTKLKDIAAQFNISEMQLYRIKSGANWSHIKLEE